VAHGVLDPRRWQELALLCGAFFMVLLDGTITLVALPSIEAGLGFANQGAERLRAHLRQPALAGRMTHDAAVTAQAQAQAQKTTILR
jgi:hypothetical protein